MKSPLFMTGVLAVVAALGSDLPHPEMDECIPFPKKMADEVRVMVIREERRRRKEENYRRRLPKGHPERIES